MFLQNGKLEKMGILILVVAAVLIPLNLYQKKVGKQVALCVTVVVIAGAAFMAYNIMNEQENFESNVVDQQEQQEQEEAMVQAQAQAQAQVQAQVQAQAQAQLQAQAQIQAQAQQADQQQVEQQLSFQNMQAPNDNSSGVNPSLPLGENEDYLSVGGSRPNGNRRPNECYPRDVLNPEELLPQDTNSTWAQVVPAGQGSISDQNFLNAGHHIGINTVGQTLRNANRGLRSEPPNPQIKVSPWMQTTIEPDLNRAPLEIGH